MPWGRHSLPTHRPNSRSRMGPPGDPNRNTTPGGIVILFFMFLKLERKVMRPMYLICLICAVVLLGRFSLQAEARGHRGEGCSSCANGTCNPAPETAQAKWPWSKPTPPKPAPAPVVPAPCAPPVCAPEACTPATTPGACAPADDGTTDTGRRHPVLKIVKGVGKGVVKTVDAVKPLKRLAARRGGDC
jgi:hypothetical protein